MTRITLLRRKLSLFCPGYLCNPWLFCPCESVDRHLGLPIHGMEGKFLPGRSADFEDASVLLREVFDHRDQLYFSPDSRAEDNRELENADAGEIPVRAESAPENHALVQVEGLRRHPRIFLQRRNPPGRTT